MPFVLFLLITLLVAVGLFSVSANAQTPTTPLQPTQVIADIPQEYNQTFPLQWGGGSLFQLKQRLATMGCIVDTIFVYDNNRWNAYNQYQVPSTLTAQFTAEYSQFIPAGTLYASCYDICEFNYYDAPKTLNPRCSTIEVIRQHNFFDVFALPIDNSNPCTTNFDPKIEASVLPSMPTYPDKCIIRQQTPERQLGNASISHPLITTSNALYPYHPAIIVMYEPTTPHDVNDSEVVLLNAEIHELCHTNQYWHSIENLKPDVVINVNGGFSVAKWGITQASREFIDLVGFTQNSNGDWVLPANSPYNDLYSINPIELSAELCAMYFTDRMGEQSAYDLTLVDFDINTYLTPAIINWLETYVALPN